MKACVVGVVCFFSEWADDEYLGKNMSIWKGTCWIYSLVYGGWRSPWRSVERQGAPAMCEVIS